MDKFKDLVMKVSDDVCPDQKSFIEARLTGFVSKFRTPNHPPYAAMIHKAIEELNQKGGSSRESISDYIKQQNHDLPLAHNSLLKHHLGELCNSGELVVTRKHLYKLVGAETAVDTCARPEKEKLKKKKRVSGKGHERQGKKDEDSDTYAYAPCGQVMGEHDRCNKEKDDLIREDMEMNEYNANKVEELNQSVKRIKRQETEVIAKQSHQDVQQPPATFEPVSDSNANVDYLENPSQQDISTPERPPGFEFPIYQSEQVQDQFEMLANSKKLSEISDEQLRQGQVKFEYQNSKCLGSAPSLMLPETSPLQHEQQQQLELLEDLQGVKSKDATFVKQNQSPIKQYVRRKYLKSQTQEKKAEGLGKSEPILAKEHLGFLHLDKSESSCGKSRQQFEFREENREPEFELEFCREKQAPESELSGQQFVFCEENKKPEFEFYREKQTLKSEFEFYREKQTLKSEFSASHMNPNMWHKEKQHSKLGLKIPVKQQATTKVLRRSPRLSKPKETCTCSSDVLLSFCLQDHPLGIVELQNHDLSQQVEKSPQLNMDTNFVCLTQKLQQLHLCDLDYSQTEKQSATSLELASAQVQVDESPKVLQQQAKPSSCKKWCASQGNVQTGCLSLSLVLKPKVVQVQQEYLHSKIQEEYLHSEIHQQLEVVQVQQKYLHSEIHQQLEPLKQLLSTQLQSLEKSPMEYPGQNRSPELGRGYVDMQSMIWDCQKQQTSRRGRGRPPKIKSAGVNSNYKNISQTRNQHTVAPTEL